jgi:hypothetical protein
VFPIRLVFNYLRRERYEPSIGTPIAFEKQRGFKRLMFGFEKEKMLAVTIKETATEERWILRGHSLQPPKREILFYECTVRLFIQSSTWRGDQAARRQESTCKDRAEPPVTLNLDRI